MRPCIIMYNNIFARCTHALRLVYVSAIFNSDVIDRITRKKEPNVSLSRDSARQKKLARRSRNQSLSLNSEINRGFPFIISRFNAFCHMIEAFGGAVLDKQALPG